MADEIQAWNNFVINSHHSDCKKGSERRAAAIANTFMGLANNGGLNYFLTYSFDLDAREVVTSLEMLGARAAAAQLRSILDGLEIELVVQSEDERWDLLEQHWTDGLDDHDVFGGLAHKQLLSALEKHVSKNRLFYLDLV